MTNTMKENNEFNLVDEKWISLQSGASVSLMDIFSDTTLKLDFLSGTPTQKISLFKLLLAISQSAFTPKTTEELHNCTLKEFTDTTTSYLEKHRDKFFLFGDKPFLQHKELEKSVKPYSYGDFTLGIATGNKTVLQEIQQKKDYNDVEIANLLVELQGFALGGKKHDKDIILSKSKDYIKKTAGYGASLGYFGILHSFLLLEKLIPSIFVNTFSEEQIQGWGFFPNGSNGIGRPPWEEMPLSEDDEIADNLKHSYMGRLVPLSRFCLLDRKGIKLTEGIVHRRSNEEELGFDPSMTQRYTKDKNKVVIRSLNCDPEKQAWRELNSFLSFLAKTSSQDSWSKNLQIEYGLYNARHSKKLELDKQQIIIWSGGLKVSSNSGEQYCSGSDDYVDSQISLYLEDLNSINYEKIQNMLDHLKKISAILYSSVRSYCLDFSINKNDANNKATRAGGEFWISIEKDFKDFVLNLNKYENKEDSHNEIYKNFTDNINLVALYIYGVYCPKNTARQVLQWEQHKPRLWKKMEV